jgi:SAM-dependent methyltransferase
MTDPHEERRVDDYWAQVYDKLETQRDDVALLRELIGEAGRLRILEPFCGNGRIFIPLAEDGHEILGMDRSEAMLDAGRAKLRRLPEEVRARVSLRRADVTAEEWPGGFDVVILGANCFYELAAAEEQEGCIRSARAALKPGGWLFLDNNHMEGDLDAGWCRLGETEVRPERACPDGATLVETVTTVWVDRPRRLWRARRTTEVRTPGGEVLRKEWVQQKHPPSTAEMRGWLERHGFTVLQLWGDRKKSAYTDRSGRAIFWARLEA